MPESGKLIVRRSKDRFGRFRRWNLYADGTRAGSVSAGSTFETELPPGEYDVSARMDWLYSDPVRVELQSGAVVVLEIDAPGPINGVLHALRPDRRQPYLRFAAESEGHTKRRSVGSATGAGSIRQVDDDGVVAEHVIINLTKDEALVLFEWLSRQNGADLNLGHLGLVDLAERNVLWSLHGALETTLAETFLPEYGDIIESARRRLHPSE